MTKRAKAEQDFVDIDNVNKEMFNANIVGIITMLSPLKKSKRNTDYFDGQLIDATEAIRLCSFSPAQHKQLQEHHKSTKPITLSGCSITNDETTGKYELKLQTKTTLSESVDDINIADILQKTTTIEAIQDRCTHDITHLEAKVIAILDVISVSAKHQKQDIILAHKSATIKLTVWDNNTEKLELDQCYKSNNLQVRVYQDIKCLTPSREGFSYTAIADIDDTDNNLSDYDFGTILKGTIIGVNNIKYLMVFVQNGNQ